MPESEDIMKKWEYRVYWADGSWNRMCEYGLDHGCTLYTIAHDEIEAETDFQCALDHVFIDAIENDPEFRYWKAIKIDTYHENPLDYKPL